MFKIVFHLFKKKLFKGKYKFQIQLIRGVFWCESPRLSHQWLSKVLIQLLVHLFFYFVVQFSLEKRQTAKAMNIFSVLEFNHKRSRKSGAFYD